MEKISSAMRNSCFEIPEKDGFDASMDEGIYVITSLRLVRILGHQQANIR